MNINEYKGILENIVHDSLYVINELDEKQNKYLNDMVKYLNECEDYFNDFRILISSKNNEQEFVDIPVINIGTTQNCNFIIFFIQGF